MKLASITTSGQSYHQALAMASIKESTTTSLNKRPRDDSPFIRGISNASWRTRLRDRTKIGKRCYDEDKSRLELLWATMRKDKRFKTRGSNGRPILDKKKVARAESTAILEDMRVMEAGLKLANPKAFTVRDGQYPARRRNGRTLSQGDRSYRGRAPKYQPFNFLGLPKDIRKMIYEQAIFDRELEYLPLTPGDTKQPDQQYETLSKVCSKIGQEAAPVYYQNIIFDFGTRLCQYSPFVRALALLKTGTANIGLIRSMYLMFNDPLGYYTTSAYDYKFYAETEPCHEFLRLLGQKSRVRDLTIAFVGKRQVTTQHRAFIQHLKTIKADRLVILDAVSKASERDTEQWNELASQLREAMVRQPRMYRDCAREEEGLWRVTQPRYMDG